MDICLWILDSNAEEHSCKDLTQLINGHTYNVKGDVRARGMLPWLKLPGKVINVPIVNVKIQPSALFNVISLPVLLNRNFGVSFKKGKCEILRSGEIVLEAIWEDEMYVVTTLNISLDCKDCSENANLHKDSPGEYLLIGSKTSLDKVNAEEDGNDIKSHDSSNYNFITRKSEDLKDLNTISAEEQGVWRTSNGDNIEKTAFDDHAAIEDDLKFDWATSPLNETKINVDNDMLFSRCEYDSPINSMDIIIMNSLSLYAERESVKTCKSFKVSKPFNGKEAYKRSNKTEERSFKHKQCKQPQESLPLLQLSPPLHEETEKIRYKPQKRNLKILRTYECDLKLQPNEGSAGSDTVIIAKSFVKINVTIRFMCLNSEPMPTFPSCERKISFVMNKCVEDRQEYFNVFLFPSCMGDSAKEEKQISNNYNRQPSIEEQIWHNQSNDVIWLSIQAWFSGRGLEVRVPFLYFQLQAIADSILAKIIQLHLYATIKCNVHHGNSLIDWKGRKLKHDIQYILRGRVRFVYIIYILIWLASGGVLNYIQPTCQYLILRVT